MSRKWFPRCCASLFSQLLNVLNRSAHSAVPCTSSSVGAAPFRIGAIVEACLFVVYTACLLRIACFLCLLVFVACFVWVGWLAGLLISCYLFYVSYLIYCLRVCLLAYIGGSPGARRLPQHRWRDAHLRTIKCANGRV